MADDNIVRSNRPGAPYRRRSGETGAPAHDTPAHNMTSDPLAELARLIGQSDPFTESARPAIRTHAQPEAAYPPEPDWPRSTRPQFYDDEPQAAPAHLGGQYSQEPYADPYGSAEAGHVPEQWHDPQGQPYDDRYYQDHHAAAYAGSDQPPAHHAVAIGTHGSAGYDDQGADYDDDYDDPPQRKRGSFLVTAATLVGCALLGSAGAYGYRALTTEGGAKRAPVIVADRTPAKIVPAEAQKKPAKTQTAQQGPGERLVPREEQPVMLKPPASPSPRVVLAAPVPSSGAPALPPVASAPPPMPTTTSSVPSSANEPKRIRTVTIRSDGGDASGRPPRNGAPPERSSPAHSAPPTAARAQQPVAIAPPARQQAPVDRTPPRAQVGRDAPLSLAPNASAASTESPSAQQRTLTPPAPRLAALPPAAASKGGNGGNYLVQVSSQRSEADARASFRSLQGKYPHVLSGRQPIVRRADLGKRGVFYRAMVGPFANASQANQWCSSLKAAGGQCIVQRN
jgi:hypothetical protein